MCREREQWVQAEAVAVVAFRAATTPLEEIEAGVVLERVYTRSDAIDPKVEAVWARLGPAYCKNAQIEPAEIVHTRLFAEFRKFEQGMTLAEVLVKQDKTTEAVQIYFEIFGQAIVRQKFDQVGYCIGGIRAIDPEMECLESGQRLTLATQIPNLPPRGEIALPRRSDFFIGSSVWKEFLGPILEVPSLPARIEEILVQPCPYSDPFSIRKKIWQTHVLLLVPTQVSMLVPFLNPGQGLSIAMFKSMAEHIMGPDAYGIFQAPSSICDVENPASYWALVTKEPVKRSIHKTYAEQVELLKPGYEPAPTLAVFSALVLHYKKTGNQLFKEGRIRCPENVEDRHLSIGGNWSRGESLSVFMVDNQEGTTGICGMKKLS